MQLAEDGGKANSEAIKELEQRIASIREDYEAKLDTAMQLRGGALRARVCAKNVWDRRQQRC
eukprot:3934163-Rhodomonas_salina.7